MASPGADEAGGGVPQRPAEPFRRGGGEGVGAAELLEPADEVVRPTHERDPGGVGGEVVEGHAGESGGFESFDVVFDVGVGAHVRVEGDGAAGVVGPVAPVAVGVAGEQGPLRARVAGFAAHDEARPGGPVVGVDEVGEVSDRGAATAVAVLSDGPLPAVGVG